MIIGQESTNKSVGVGNNFKNNEPVECLLGNYELRIIRLKL